MKYRIRKPSAALKTEDTETAEERRMRLTARLKRDALIKVMLSAAAVFILFTFVFGITTAASDDMFPAVKEGDVLIFCRRGSILNSDVVVYESPEGEERTGRVAATQGESLGRTDGGLLTINGNIQPVQKRSGLYEETGAGRADLKGIIADGDYLILGDHREEALDSRAFGLIPRSSIKGKVFTIIRRRSL